MAVNQTNVSLHTSQSSWELSTNVIETEILDHSMLLFMICYNEWVTISSGFYSGRSHCLLGNPKEFKVERLIERKVKITRQNQETARKDNHCDDF